MITEAPAMRQRSDHLDYLAAADPQLKPNELKALQLAADGESLKSSAAILGTTGATVKNLRHSAAVKLGADNTLHAVVQALRKGLILKPLDIGTLAGKANSTVRPYLEFFSKRPTLPFPEGDKFGEWYQRIRKEWIHQFGDDDPVIAVVSHTRDWQLLKHWQRNGLDAGPEGIQFDEPDSGQVAKVVRRGNSIQVRKIA